MKTFVSPLEGADKSPHSKVRGGFSLAEVVVGTGVLAMFMMATPLAIRMATKAVPDGKNTASATMTASRVMELMASDIAFATSVNASPYDSNNLSFTVPDRNGDGLSETVYYSCATPPAGTIPQPAAGIMWLTRQYNSSAATTLLNNVLEFNFNYDTLSVPLPPGTVQGANTLLASNTGTGGYGQVTVNGSNSFAQYVEPVLPANTINWTLTKVQLQMQQAAAGGSVVVQIRPAIGGLPSNTVLGQVTLSGFPVSMAWQDINFNNLTGLSPYSGFCVVIINAGGNAACSLQFCNNSSGTGGYLNSNGGATWSQNAGKDFQFTIYGQVATPNTGSAGANYYLTDVQCKLRTNQNNSSRIVTSIRTYNQPQVPHP